MAKKIAEGVGVSDAPSTLSAGAAIEAAMAKAIEDTRAEATAVLLNEDMDEAERRARHDELMSPETVRRRMLEARDLVKTGIAE